MTWIWNAIGVVCERQGRRGADEGSLPERSRRQGRSLIVDRLRGSGRGRELGGVSRARSAGVVHGEDAAGEGDVQAHAAGELYEAVPIDRHGTGYCCGALLWQDAGKPSQLARTPSSR